MELNQVQKELVQKNIKLVYSVASKLNVLNNSDAVQEGIMGLCIAASRFDTSKSKFSTYATCYIKYYILTFLKYNRTIKPFRKGGEFVYAKSDEFLEDRYGNFDKRFENFDKEDCLLRFMEKLDDTTKIIIQMYKEGMTQNEIANKLGHSQPHICRKINNTLELIKEKGIWK